MHGQSKMKTAIDKSWDTTMKYLAIDTDISNLTHVTTNSPVTSLGCSLKRLMMTLLLYTC